MSVNSAPASQPWSREVTRLFIGYFRDQPSLWKVKSDEYKNRDIKQGAYRKIIENMGNLNVILDENGVKNKINNLRSQFRKEYKIFSSKKSGMSADDIYKPSLW